MKKIICIVIAALSAVFTLHAQGGTVEKSTHLFSEKNGEKLYLDKYDLRPEIGIQVKKPCIIFVFGGAFARGQRDVEKYIPYFNELCANGYIVVSIDYHLGLKNIGEETDLNEERLVGMFINTVDMALEDLIDATAYVIENADAWNIDERQLVANGSSAGAVTVLQGAYAISNGLKYTDRLPAGFNYAGVISFAGAVFTDNDDLVWGEKPCPIMVMHGDRDRQVPYDNLKMGNFGLYGGKYVAETLENIGSPYLFHSFISAGHEIASSPMEYNKAEILDFLDKYVMQGKQLQTTITEKPVGAVPAQEILGVEDYLNGNFGI